MISMNEIKVELKKQGITQKSLAKKLNISENAVNKWFSGISQPTMSRYEQILEILGLNNNRLYIAPLIGSQTTKSGNINTSYGNNSTIHGNNTTIVKKDTAIATDTNIVKIPVINYVQAGEFTDHPESVEPIRYELAAISQNLPRNSFALEVKGPSMKFDYAPTQLLDEKLAKYSINAGELVVIDTSQINLSDLIGKVIVAINGDGTTVKLVYEDEKGLCLMPLNSKYQTRDEIKRPGEVRILGRVVKIITPSRDI